MMPTCRRIAVSIREFFKRSNRRDFSGNTVILEVTSANPQLGGSQSPPSLPATTQPVQRLGTTNAPEHGSVPTRNVPEPPYRALLQ